MMRTAQHILHVHTQVTNTTHLVTQENTLQHMNQQVKNNPIPNERNAKMCFFAKQIDQTLFDACFPR